MQALSFIAGILIPPFAVALAVLVLIWIVLLIRRAAGKAARLPRVLERRGNTRQSRSTPGSRPRP